MSGSSARGAATDLASPGLLSIAGTTIQIPAPATLPLRGLDLLRASRNIIAAWTSEHYRIPIVEHRFFGRRLFVLNDPAAIQHVLLDNASNYEKSLIARRLLAPALGRGLLTSEGEFWHRQRHLMAPFFHAKKVLDYVAIACAALTSMTDRWAGLRPGTVIDLADEAKTFALDVICRILFGNGSPEAVPAIGRLVMRYQEAVASIRLPDLLRLPDWFPRRGNGIARRTSRDLDVIIGQLIAGRRFERQDASERADELYDRLRALADAGEMSLPQLRDEITTLFVAGHETTAGSLAWTLCILAMLPEIEGSVLAELDRELGNGDLRTIDLGGLACTRQVIEETLRLFPAAHTLSREPVVDDVLCGRELPARSIIIISPWVLHRHEELWRDPNRFDPGRFSEAAKHARAKFAYLPFGGGARTCLGASLAMVELLVAVAGITRQFEIRIVPGQRIEPTARITLWPRDGIKAVLRPR
jgi:cytochrome P450